MADQKAKTLSQEFCRAWFERRDPEETLTFLTEDVTFVGTGEGEYAQGKAEMAAYLREDILEIPEPFAWIYRDSPAADPGGCRQSFSSEIVLKNTVYIWRLRCFFTLVEAAEGVWEIASLHFAEPGNSQQGAEHYPQTLVIRKTRSASARSCSTIRCPEV